jgi:hypothetical protein
MNQSGYIVSLFGEKKCSFFPNFPVEDFGISLHVPVFTTHQHLLWKVLEISCENPSHSPFQESETVFVILMSYVEPQVGWKRWQSQLFTSMNAENFISYKPLCYWKGL